MKFEDKAKELEILYKDDKEDLLLSREIMGDLLESKSINDLPYIDSYDNDVYEILDNIFGDSCEFIIKDGTRVVCEKHSCKCFKDRENHWYFYNINNEFYICAECGTKMKYYHDIWNELINKFNMEEYCYDEIVLPNDWDDNCVRKYFKKIIVNNIKQLKRNEYRNRLLAQEKYLHDRQEYEDLGCSACINYKNNECFYNKSDDGSCEDFELRDSPRTVQN